MLNWPSCVELSSPSHLIHKIREKSHPCRSMFRILPEFPKKHVELDHQTLKGYEI